MDYLSTLMAAAIKETQISANKSEDMAIKHNERSVFLLFPPKMREVSCFIDLGFVLQSYSCFYLYRQAIAQ